MGNMSTYFISVICDECDEDDDTHLEMFTTGCFYWHVKQQRWSANGCRVSLLNVVCSHILKACPEKNELVAGEYKINNNRPYAQIALVRNRCLIYEKGRLIMNEKKHNYYNGHHYEIIMLLLVHN